MKSIKTMLFGACALLGGVHLAGAQIVVHFTGSTAYRGATQNAIKAAFDSSPTVVYGYTGSSFGSANASVFSGNISGSSTVIKCTWTGSEAGLQTVGQSGSGTSIYYVLNTPTVGGTAAVLTTGGTPNLDDPTGSDPATHPSRYEFTVPDVAMADTYQTSSQFFTTGSNTFNGSNYPALSPANVTPAGVVGVVPFKFVASSHATFTNITSQQFRALFSKGRLPKALLTGSNAVFASGSSADELKYVYAVGRDPDSGTRLTALAETGYGATKSVKQNEPLDSGSALITSASSTISSLVFWPTETVNGITVNTPNGGYNSGGKLAGALASETSSMSVTQGSFTSTGGDLVGYLSTGDADGTALANGAKELAYNGVTLGNTGGNYNNDTNLTEGAYTFWGYEHMYYRSGSAVSAIADQIAALIQSTYATVFLSSMHVTRTTDGGNVTANY